MKKLPIILSAIIIINSAVVFDCAVVNAENIQQEARYVEGEVLVTLNEEVTANKAEEILGYDVEIAGDEKKSDVVIAEIEDDNIDDAIEEIEDNPEVENVQPNYIYEIEDDESGQEEGTISYTNLDDCWYFDYIDLKEAWDFIENYRSDKSLEKVKVATLDSGADTSHPDLQENLDKEHSVDVTKSGYPINSYTGSHGTSTAGVIAATANNGNSVTGVASGNNNDFISLMAIKVFRNGKAKKQKYATTKDVIKGLKYACENGAQVINMCLGHSPNSADAIGGKHNDKLLKKEIAKAVQQYDVVICASAGNNNNKKTWYPSDYDDCISVIATKHYTNAYQKCKYSTSSYGPKKDISAPGESIYNTAPSNEYCKSNGTSYAVCLATGVAALVRYVNPELTVAEVKNILYSTATDLYKTGKDNYTGYGNVNAYSAVTTAAGEPDSIPTEQMSVPSVKAVSNSSSAIKITCSGSSRLSGFDVYRKSGSQYSYVGTTSSNKYINTGLSFNKKYSYYVLGKGTTADGKKMAKSDASVIVSAKPITGKTTVKVTKKKKGKVKIAWTKAASASGYIIYASKYPNRGFVRKKKITKPKKGNCILKAPNKNKKPSYYKIIPYRKVKKKVYYGPCSAIKKK